MQNVNCPHLKLAFEFVQFIGRYVSFLVVICLSLTSCQSLNSEVYERTEIGYYYGNGITKIDESRYNAAASNLSEGLKHYRNSGLFTLRGYAYCKLGKYARAIDDFNLALKYKKSEAYDIASVNRHLSKIRFYKENFIYANRGLAFSYLAEFDKAFDDIDRVIKSEPGESIWYCYRALAFLNASKFDSALKDIAIAIKLKPKNASAYHIRAQVYEALGDEKSASEDSKVQRVLNYKEESDITKYNIR